MADGRLVTTGVSGCRVMDLQVLAVASSGHFALSSTV